MRGFAGFTLIEDVFTNSVILSESARQERCATGGRVMSQNNDDVFVAVGWTLEPTTFGL